MAAFVLVASALPADAATLDNVRESQWYLSFLEVRRAQRLSTGAGVTVGLVDTGVFPHEDLKNNLLSSDGGKLNNATVGETSDQNGHGTRMAGLIAAHGRPGDRGLIGIAPAAKIVPIKISGLENADSLDIAAGIEKAISRSAEVINVSFAASPSIELEDAVTHAIQADALLIAGSGNRPRMTRLGYPAASSGVLAVGAVDEQGRHAKISMTGNQVAICAPGVNIESTQPNGKYSFSDGTSPATAIVSGAAALVRSKFPELTAPQVIQRLTATADDIGPPGRDDECGFGVLNIVKALTADIPVTGGSSAPASAPSQQVRPSNVASPGSEPGGLNLLAIAGGLIGLALVGGLVAVLALRRRQSS